LELALFYAAERLGPICDEVVFVGGAVRGLLVTDAGAADVRPTDDVDVIVEVSSLAAYQQLESRLRSQGFKNDPREDAPICRFVQAARLRTIAFFTAVHPASLGYHSMFAGGRFGSQRHCRDRWSVGRVAGVGGHRDVQHRLSVSPRAQRGPITLARSGRVDAVRGRYVADALGFSPLGSCPFGLALRLLPREAAATACARLAHRPTLHRSGLSVAASRSVLVDLSDAIVLEDEHGGLAVELSVDGLFGISFE